MSKSKVNKTKANVDDKSKLDESVANSNGKGNVSGCGNIKNQKHGKVNRDVKGKGKEDMTKRTGNDPSFYGKNAALVENMTNIYFNHPTGFPIPGSDATVSNVGREATGMCGILSVPLIPTYGDTQSFDSPLGMAGKMIYMAMSSKTGRKAEYQMSDVLQYLMAMDNIYMHIAEAQRVYGLFKMISPFNRYMPEALLRALGWKYSDVASKPAEFRYQINRVVEMVNQLVMPEFNDLFKLHMSLLNAVYYDHDAVSAKPQYIVLTLGGGGYRYFDELGLLTYGHAAKAYTSRSSFAGPTAHKWFCNYNRGSLYDPSLNYLWTVEKWLNYMLDCINDIMGSETFTKISTDLMLRFNTSGFVQLNPIPEDYVTPFVYDQNVMMMLQNATYAGTDYIANGFISDSVLYEFKSDVNETKWDGVYANYLSHDGVDVQAIKSRVGIEALSLVTYQQLDNGKTMFFDGLLHNKEEYGYSDELVGISMLGNIAQHNHILNLDFDYQPNGLNLLEATRLMYHLGSYNHLFNDEIPESWIPTGGNGRIQRPWYLDFVDYGFWIMLKPKLFVYNADNELIMMDWKLNKYSYQFFKGPRMFDLNILPAGDIDGTPCDIVAVASQSGEKKLCKTTLTETVEYQLMSPVERDFLKKLNYIAVSSVLRVPVTTIPDMRN